METSHRENPGRALRKGNAKHGEAAFTLRGHEVSLIPCYLGREQTEAMNDFVLPLTLQDLVSRN